MQKFANPVERWNRNNNARQKQNQSAWFTIPRTEALFPIFGAKKRVISVQSGVVDSDSAGSEFLSLFDPGLIFFYGHKLSS